MILDSHVKARIFDVTKNCEASPAACRLCPEASGEQQLSLAKQVWKCTLHTVAELTARDRFRSSGGQWSIKILLRLVIIVNFMYDFILN